MVQGRKYVTVGTCDRHWGRPSAGLFRVAGSEFGISSWMCGECVKTRADQKDVQRQAARKAGQKQ